MRTAGHKDLELVRKGILNEDEFARENEKRQVEAASLTERREELAAWVSDQAERHANAATLPKRVRSFLKDFRQLDVKRAKALLQSIVQAAHVSNDGRIELVFR